LVTTEIAEYILQAASFMQIQCLQELCENVLSDIVTGANCIRLWQLAKHHGYSILENTTRNFLWTAFSTVVTTESFMELDIDDLLSVLENGYLLSPSEDSICAAAMTWLEYNFDTRKQFLTRVLRSLKLPLTSHDYLLNFKTHYPFLEMDEEANQILTDACNCHMRSARQADSCSTPFEHTKCSGMGDTHSTCPSTMSCILPVKSEHQTDIEMARYSEENVGAVESKPDMVMSIKSEFDMSESVQSTATTKESTYYTSDVSESDNGATDV
jgi:hypothetical protein